MLNMFYDGLNLGISYQKEISNSFLRCISTFLSLKVALNIFRDTLFLMDWKTASSGSSKDTCTEIEKMYNDPLQLAAYVGAVNSDPNFCMLPEVGIMF